MELKKKHSDSRFYATGNEAEDKKKFEEYGFLVYKNFIDSGLVNQIRGEWEKFHSSGLDSLHTKQEPLVVFWKHVPGEKKKFRPISEFNAIKKLAFHEKISNLVHKFSNTSDTRLLETIIFSKPPSVSPKLNWHQDVAYFPFEPNNQMAVWLPLEPVFEETGAMQYVVGTNKKGLMGSIDLHTNKPFAGEDRPLIPADPVKEGYEIYCCEIDPGDMIIHDGKTWHCSGPNVTADNQRRGLSLRYLVGETTLRLRPGSAASFISQVEVKNGDVIEGPAFPNV